MAESIGTLHFICGRLASGKTTLARTLVAQERAVLICEDVLAVEAERWNF